MNNPRNETKPIALVTPWFAANLTGGAEQQAWQLAHRLAARRIKVEVLTTCNRGFESDWTTNDLAAGSQSLNDNLTVRRFPVARRNTAWFDRVNRKLLEHPTGSATLDERIFTPADEETFLQNNINSHALAAYAQAHAKTYSAFLFVPYLYGTTLNVLPAVAASGGRTLLQPCLHDEAYARAPAVAQVFYQADKLLFNSSGEAELAAQLYGVGVLPRSLTVGEGIEWETLTKDNDATDENGTDALEQDAATLRQLLASDAARFVLYLGRKSRAKNTDLLVAAFAHFKANNPSSKLRLVLAGAGTVDTTMLPEACLGDLFDLGFVGGRAKSALLKSCAVLFQPSRNESYSRAMMEAWALGKTVAANRECLATAKAVEESGGGWLAGDSVTEWSELFARTETSSLKELMQTGKLGHAYAAEFAQWDKVIDRYQAVLASFADEIFASEMHDAQARRAKNAESLHFATGDLEYEQFAKDVTAIHQLLPDLAYGDAISNQALAIRASLRARGYRSEIFVKRAHAQVAHEAIIFNGQHTRDADRIARQDGLIYHHSIGSELTSFAVRHQGAKCLVYHNITPAEFFRPFRPGFAWMLEAGRAELSELATSFPVAVGDSQFNAVELAQCGFTEPCVLPIIVDPARWNFAADRRLLTRLQDGRTNLLFVGRVAPNKRQDEIIETFKHYLAIDPRARLVLVGDCRDFDPYCRQIKSAARELIKNGSLIITGQTTDAELAAYYRAAHVFISLSEHEGFGVPVVEAMWFDVPVVAYVAAENSSAVGETMGDAGVKLQDKKDLRAVAGKIRALVEDRDSRAQVIAAQRVRRECFTPVAVQPALDKLIARMLNAAQVRSAHEMNANNERDLRAAS